MARRVEVLVCLLCLLLPSFAWADGGTVRASEQIDGYLITVFSSPTPFRAGPVDISVLVQDAAGDPVSHARVTIRIWPAGQPQQATVYPATLEAATNKLFYDARFDLPTEGLWTVEVSFESGESRDIRFDLEAGKSLPRWAEMGLWIWLPFLPIALFIIHLLMVRRSEFRRSSISSR